MLRTYLDLYGSRRSRFAVRAAAVWRPRPITSRRNKSVWRTPRRDDKITNEPLRGRRQRHRDVARSPAPSPLPPVLRVNVSDGYERHSGDGQGCEDGASSYQATRTAARGSRRTARISPRNQGHPTPRVMRCCNEATMEGRRPSSRPPSPGTGAPCVCSMKMVHVNDSGC